MTVFRTSLKRILVQPINWAFMILFPVVFAVLVFASNGAEVENATNVEFYFGVVDQDRSVLSQALVEQLEVRYNTKEFIEEDISAALTDSAVPWILLIREGYARDVLAGYAPILEGYSLTASDVSALGSVAAQNITRSLILLGTDDPAVLSAWEDASRVEDKVLVPGERWELTAFWFGFYGFVSLFTAYFIVKTMIDDKRRGMPDRLGVLPIKPRTVLIQGTLAAFLATEVTAAALLGIIQLQLGAIPNPMHLFLLLSLYNLFSVGMVLAITSVAKNMGSASMTMTMLATVFAMLGGLFWPLDFVPEFMQRLAWFSPGYWLSRGLHHMQDINFTGYWMPLLFLSGFTVVAMLLGGWKKIQPIEE